MPESFASFNETWLNVSSRKSQHEMKFYRIKALILHNSLHQNIKLQSPLASHSQSLCPSLISSPSFGEILNEIFKSFFNGLGVLI
jgi:hypothetical protein